ncbi:WD40 repeat-like protein [Gonapodya prolifera JEL478]|uniref:WD40 repeat-like protein n=1 Tax=Gonapodya prolifera (strain JEL478) TaxID=1344416 RepID=A0A139AT89_GONPJ|nr:WD40 repeat-like protein [Gonapodya prolifera JEL478]|eukprot:KXS19936.1 WD40 repeat-like protein [Gonapodya prolifera JEL478]
MTFERVDSGETGSTTQGGSAVLSGTGAFAAPSSGSEAYLREQIDKLFKENKTLRHKYDLLERENEALKQSLFDLTMRYNVELASARAAAGTNSNSKSFLKLDLGGPDGVATGQQPEASPASTTPSTSDQRMRTPPSPTSPPAYNQPPTSPSSAVVPSGGSRSPPSNAATSTQVPLGIEAQPNRASSPRPERNSGSVKSRAISLGQLLNQSPASVVAEGGGASRDPQTESAAGRSSPPAFRLTTSPSPLPPHRQSSFSSSSAVLSLLPSTPSIPSTTPFLPAYDLKRHSGAVFAVKFSPTGRLLATAGFDARLCLWDVADSPDREPREWWSATRGKSNVADVAWNAESTSVLSGSYDRMCRLWDVERGQSVGEWSADGFVGSVAWGGTDQSLFMCTTSRKSLHVFDRRTPSTPVLTMRADTSLSCLLPLRSGDVLTGDMTGCVRTWDTRAGKQEAVFHVDGNAGVTWIGCAEGENPPKHYAISSHDNALRVYHFSSDQIPFAQPTQPTYVLRSHRTRGWPIKASWFTGNVSELTRNVDVKEEVMRGVGVGGEKPPPYDAYMFLATGSGENCGYVYGVTGPGTPVTEDSFSSVMTPIQRLACPSDRAYCIDFQPYPLTQPPSSTSTGSSTTTFPRIRAPAMEGAPAQPLVAAGCADGTVRLWGWNGGAAAGLAGKRGRW